MPDYFYTARDERGVVSNGSITATSDSTAARILQGRGLTVTRLSTLSSEAPVAASTRRRHYRIAATDLLFFIRQTAVLLDAGIPLLRALDIMAEQIESRRLLKAVEAVRLDVKGGTTFKHAMARHPKIFPPLWTFLIEAGETSGDLPLVLNQIADHYETAVKLRQKIVSALIYPCILVLLSIGAVLTFLLKVIPVFADLYAQFHATLPALTLFILKLSDFLRHTVLIIIGSLVLALFLLARYFATPQGRRVADAFLIRLPIIGELIQYVILARLCVNLATLIRSGVNLIQCLEISARTAGNVIYEEALKNVLVDVQQGKSLATALKSNPLFHPLMMHMAAIGEEGGRLPEMMARAAKEYENRVDIFITRLAVVIEPVILIFVGGIVGILVAAMFLPIFSLGSAIRGS